MRRGTVDDQNTVPQTWDKFFKVFRKRSGLTQDELANRFGYDGRTVRNWERGKTVPSVHVVTQLVAEKGENLPDIVHHICTTNAQITRSAMSILRANCDCRPWRYQTAVSDLPLNQQAALTTLYQSFLAQLGGDPSSIWHTCRDPIALFGGTLAAIRMSQDTTSPDVLMLLGFVCVFITLPSQLYHIAQFIRWQKSVCIEWVTYRTQN